jgi:site-specific DNA recombinase
MTIAPMTIAMYARVSNQRHGQTQSIEQQVERLRTRAAQLEAEHGERGAAGPSAARLFRDEGYSGATLRRPGLDALRDAVAAAAVNYVLITAPDRLARNYVHQVLLLEELERFGCVVEFLDRPMSQDPHDPLLLQIRGAVAEYERTLIVERMRRGRLAKLRAGTLLPWTRVPYGLSVDPDRPRDPAGVHIDPVAGAHIQELFLGYLQEQATLSQLVATLVATLERQGIPTPQGGRHWNRSTVRWLLSNPVYMGHVYAGRTRTYPSTRRRSALQPVAERGARMELADRQEWMLVTTIPAIVSPDVFDRVQATLAENRRLARRHTSTGQYLLRALVSCGVCGYACTGRQEKPRYAYATPPICVPGRPPRDRGGRICPNLPKSLGEHCPARYIPARYIPARYIPARYIPVRALDELVWRDLCAVLTHPESIAHALHRSQAGTWLPQDLQARRAQLSRPAPARPAATRPPTPAPGRCLSSRRDAARRVPATSHRAGAPAGRPAAATSATGDAGGPAAGPRAGDDLAHGLLCPRAVRASASQLRPTPPTGRIAH